MKIDITIFNSKKTKRKLPISPYGNDCFDFETININFKDMPLYFSKYYILNTNCIFEKRTNIRRLQKTIIPFKTDQLRYMILDIDEVYTEEAKDRILKYFKDKDYYVSISRSRGYDGVKKFTLKGVMLVEGNNNRESILKLAQHISKGIKGLGKIDLSIISENSYQSPTLTYKSELYNPGSNIPAVYEKKTEAINIASNESLLRVCLEQYNKLGYLPVKVDDSKDLITFEHSSEKSPRGYFMFKNNPMMMNHFNSSKSFNIFHLVKETKDGKEFLKAFHRAKREIELKEKPPSGKDTIKVNTRYMSNNSETNNLISKFIKQDKSLLKIKSIMGSGKSTIIGEILVQCKKEKKPYIIVTNRISVAKDFQKKYNCNLYLNQDYQPGDNLIVQLDSLWKYNLKHFDVMILDEFMSLMLHTRNTMSDYTNLNKIKIFYGMKNKNIVIADAFLYGFEDQFFKEKSIFNIHNSYKDKTELYEYPKIDTMIFKMLELAKEEKSKNKISISTTNKKMSKLFHMILTNAGYNVMLLNADTPDSTKELVYKFFEESDHNAWDIIVYTPTLTVGVSNNNKVCHHFHYDSSNTTDVISSLQMIKRSRNAKAIHFHVAEINRMLETKLDNLNNYVLNNLSKYYRNNNQNSILIDIDEDGEFKLSETGIFVNTVEILYNSLENDHKHSFELLLKHQFNSDVKTVLGEKEFPIAETNATIKQIEAEETKQALNEIKEIEWENGLLEEYESKIYIHTNKDKMYKLLSEINKFVIADEKTLIRIAEKEIESNFKYISTLKRLRVFITNSEEQIKNKLSYLVADSITNRSYIQILDYMSTLKNKKIKFTSKFTPNEINEIDGFVTNGSFKKFLKDIGYTNKRGSYIIDQQLIEDVKLLR